MCQVSEWDIRNIMRNVLIKSICKCVFYCLQCIVASLVSSTSTPFTDFIVEHKLVEVYSLDAYI